MLSFSLEFPSAHSSTTKENQGADNNEGNGMAQESMQHYIVVFKEDATSQDG